MSLFVNLECSDSTENLERKMSNLVSYYGELGGRVLHLIRKV